MNRRIRQEIAQEAARIMVNGGLENYLQAKKKAADQLGVTDNRMLPSNSEIESALIEYQTLFKDTQVNQSLKKMRMTAIKAMQFFEQYRPRLTGSVLTGTANEHSEIILHLFHDTPEMVGLFLEKENIPSEICERRLQFKKGVPVYFTAFKFIAGDFEIVAIVLPDQYSKNPPFDPVTGKPMKRGRIEVIRKLMDDSKLPSLR